MDKYKIKIDNKNLPQYGKKEYWENMYKGKKFSHQDWLEDWEHIRDLIE